MLQGVVQTSSGARLGPYLLGPAIGAGGMGEVYRAHDARLGRDVAIKILPAEVSNDADRLQRFEQEARAAAALNHPNILTVFDVGADHGVSFLVTELLQGRTLRDVMSDQRAGVDVRRLLPEALAHPVTTAKACAWASQIALGLAAAHARHIIHRDIKPENLFITSDGRLKILDFGLARVVVPVSDDDVTALAAGMGTQPGMVMGTVAYMSPEQARGQQADEQSDIFSLGVVLYEMLAGRRPFNGASAVESMNATLTAEPAEFDPVRAIAPTLDRLVRRCLEKRPEDRLQSAHDLAMVLEAVGGSRTQSVATLAPSPRRHRALVTAALLAAVAIISVAATLWIGGARPSSLPTIERLTFRRGTIETARFETGTRNVVYSARWDGDAPTIFTVNPKSPDSQAIGGADTLLLALSPAREAAVILSPRLYTGRPGGTLAVMPLGRGGPRTLANRIIAADFAADGRLAALEYPGGKHRVHLPVGNVIYETSKFLSYLRCAPRGDLIALAAQDEGLFVIDSKGVVKATLEEGLITGIAWSADGEEIWYSRIDGSGQSTILAYTPGAVPRPVWRGTGLELHDIAADGTVLVTASEVRGGVYVERRGLTDVLDLGWLAGSRAVDISPDGDALLINEPGYAGPAAVPQSPQAGLGPTFYSRKLDGSPAVRLGAGAAIAWSPSGDTILSRTDAFTFQLVPVGAGAPRQIPHPALFSLEAWFHPDGRILVNGHGRDQPNGFWWMNESGELDPIEPSGLDGWVGQRPLSHDGRLLAAFRIGQSTTETVAIFPIDGGEPRPIIGMRPDEVIIQFTEDDRHLLVYDRDRLPVEIFKLDFQTGERSLWREFTPTNPAGISGIGIITMTPDGRVVAYNYIRSLGTAYLISGLK